MSKVITERPRAGGGSRTPKGERKRLQRDPECMPFRESTARGRKPWPMQKMQTDVLAPLRRFLERNAGRPWDKVYSEIRERIHSRSQVQLHVLDHVRQEVATNVFLRGKIPYEPHSPSWHRPPFYVHPVTGLLLKCPPSGNPWRRPRPEPPRRVEIGPDRQVHVVAGIWYEAHLAPIPADRIVEDPGGAGQRCKVRDAFLRESGSPEDFMRKYGGRRYALSKRQLGKKEIKRLMPAAVEAGLVQDRRPL
jgi:hypothetical protein